MRPSTTQFYQERFYRDVYTILSNWEWFLLRVEFLLLYKKWIPSLLFAFAVQLSFWIPIFLQLNKAFIITTMLSLAAILDLGKDWLLPKIESYIFMSTGFHMASEVRSALENREVFSIEELSFYISKGFRILLKVVNIFAPYREQRPLVFLCFSCTLSVLLICIGLFAKEHHLTYIVVNVSLILPGLFHNRIFSRIWALIKPYVDRIEAEFDRGQIESVAEREAGEKELWGPIATSPFFSQAEQRLEVSKHSYDNFDMDVDDLDVSESQFIQKFIPQRLQLSTEKNKVALDTITREIMQTCRNQDDIDDWFAEVTEDPKYHNKSSRSGDVSERRTPATDSGSPNVNSSATGEPTFSSDFDSAMWEELSTDDDAEPEGLGEDSHESVKL